MDHIICEIKTVSEYKKAMKTFVRGIIKSKIFNDENAKVNFIVTKANTVNGMFVSMSVDNTYNTAEFEAEVPTRVFNKIVDEFYTKTIEQFNKLKNFAGMTVTITEEACDY